MPSVLIYTTSLRPQWRTDGARGGPQGEIRMVDDLIEGLGALGCRVTQAPTLRWFYARRRVEQLLGWMTTPGRLVLDPWSLALAVRHGLLDDRDAARLRILEWYGTPSAHIPSSPRDLQASQYLLPYPDSRHGNHWIGFLLRDTAQRPLASRDQLAQYLRASMAMKRPQGLVWGKEGRYFTEPVRRLLTRLSRSCELHITIDEARLAGDPLDGRFINHGSMAPGAWRQLIRESAFVIGIGDPMSGPTAIEALAAGAVYLNPRFTPPRRINDVEGLEARTQHPFTETIAAPFVREYAVDEPDQAVAAAADALARVGGRPDAAPLAPLLDALEPFTWQTYLGRIAVEFDLPSGAAAAPTGIRATPHS